MYYVSSCQGIGIFENGCKWLVEKKVAKMIHDGKPYDDANFFTRTYLINLRNSTSPARVKFIFDNRDLEKPREDGQTKKDVGKVNLTVEDFFRILVALFNREFEFDIVIPPLQIVMTKEGLNIIEKRA
jgi:hypothetical protein